MTLMNLTLCFVTMATGIAGATSTFTLIVPHALDVGDSHLKAAEYTLLVQKDHVIFERGSSSIRVPVTVEEDTSAVPFTIIEFLGSRVRTIHLGGTKTKLIFAVSDDDNRRPAEADGVQRTAQRRSPK
jgi:hypothetical protein